jgi:DNA repair protein RecN (Recombination protein N)
MLEFLRIRNLALIQDLELEFSEGLNVLTGESGAGKSFILRALDFITGEKLQTDMVRPGKDKAQVEAIFALPDDEYVLRRELPAAKGRSRIYINDRLSSQERIRELRPRLLQHTSQHGQQRLLRPSYHTEILDTLVPQELVREKEEALASLRAVSKQKAEVRDKAGELEKQREFLEYQQQEIAKVDPRPGEEEELMRQKEDLRGRAERQESVNRALELLRGQEGMLLDRALELQRQVENLREAGQEFGEHADRMEDFRQFLMELERSLHAQPLAEDSEQELERIESRLWKLSQLQRKLNRSLEDILNLQQEIEDNLSFLDNCKLDLQQLERREQEQAERLATAVRSLNEARREAAGDLSTRLEGELQSLGFGKDVRVVFDFQETELFDGISELRGRLMWVPNPGQPAQPLDQIASGGELSRFLLALAGLMSRENMPTLLFDEVDAGIGGITLKHVGERIRSLADRQQVILISHWPQLACLADKHFQVSKEVLDSETFTRCLPLDRGEVAEELARMAGGGEQGRMLAQRLMQGKQVHE